VKHTAAWIHLIAALAACRSSDRANRAGDGSIPAAESTAPRSYDASELPIARWTGGVPVSSGTLTVDLAPDVAAGVVDWSREAGTVRFDCRACTVGDDTVLLRWMLAELHGHLTFDEVHARADFDGGAVRVSVSGRGDVDFDGVVVGRLGRAADDTRLDGCVSYVGTERLRARDWRLHAALHLMYPADADGRGHVAIAGTLGAPQFRGVLCAVAPAQP
jgi:hypothetical protein